MTSLSTTIASFRLAELVGTVQQLKPHQSPKAGAVLVCAHQTTNGTEVAMCMQGILLRPKATESITFARVACGRWKCPQCAERLKGVWTRHLKGCFSGSVYRTVVSPAAWSTVYKRLQRADADYAKILRDGEYVVWSSKPLEGSVRFCRHDGGEMVQGDLKAVTSPVRAVSTSRGWKLEARGPAKNEILSSKVTERAVEETAREFGVTVQRWKKPKHPRITGGLSVKTFGWTEGRVTAFACGCESRSSFRRPNQPDCITSSTADSDTIPRNRLLQPARNADRIAA